MPRHGTPPCFHHAPWSLPAALQLERQQCAALRQRLQLQVQQAEEAQLALEARLHTQQRQLLAAAARQALWALVGMAGFRHVLHQAALRCMCCPRNRLTRAPHSYGYALVICAGAVPGSRAPRWPPSSAGASAEGGPPINVLHLWLLARCMPWPPQAACCVRAACCNGLLVLPPLSLSFQCAFPGACI